MPLFESGAFNHSATFPVGPHCFVVQENALGIKRRLVLYFLEKTILQKSWYSIGLGDGVFFFSFFRCILKMLFVKRILYFYDKFTGAHFC